MFKPMEHLCRNSRTHLFFSMMLYCTRGNPFTAAGCSLVMSHLSFLSFCSCKREWSLRFTRTVYAWLDVRTLSSKEETLRNRDLLSFQLLSQHTHVKQETHLEITRDPVALCRKFMTVVKKVFEETAFTWTGKISRSRTVLSEMSAFR